MIATLDLVEMRRGGGVLTAATLTGATTLPLDVTLDYDEGGSTLSLNDVVYTYTAVGEDFVTLATGLVADAAVDDPAWTLDSQGQLEETWLAWVDLGDGGDTVPAQIPTGLVGYFPEGDTATGQAVEVEATDDGYRVLDRPDQPVLLDGASVDASTLDVTSLPPVPTTDGDAPDNATTVTPIGGIGSMFYRWTEITNNDPVTYRLHVRAGSAPTTDGTYEVAAGVGLTSAAVRKLKDGTAIVGDGSVTYHAIVTVEDADGPGPASADATGTPMQITSPDIAATAIDGMIITGATIQTAPTGTRVWLDDDGLHAHNGVTETVTLASATGALTVNSAASAVVTGATIQTAASGNRMVLEEDLSAGILKFFTGYFAEVANGYINPDHDAGLAQPILNISAPRYSADAGDAVEIRLRGSQDDGNLGSIELDAGGGTGAKVSVLGPLEVLGTLTSTDLQAGTGSVGTGSFRDSVDARANAVAPTVTMTTGGVGTGAFRTSVDARVTAVAPTPIAAALADNIRRTTAATGADKWVARAWRNASATTIATSFVGYFDSTCAEGDVLRAAGAINHPNPLVAVEDVAASATGGFAEPGSVLLVACDTGAVAVGDSLVTSTTAAGRAKADNAVTNPRLIVGTARTAKAAGANGTVKVYVR